MRCGTGSAGSSQEQAQSASRARLPKTHLGDSAGAQAQRQAGGAGRQGCNRGRRGLHVQVDNVSGAQGGVGVALHLLVDQDVGVPQAQGCSRVMGGCRGVVRKQRWVGCGHQAGAEPESSPAIASKALQQQWPCRTPIRGPHSPRCVTRACTVVPSGSSSMVRPPWHTTATTTRSAVEGF